LESLGHEFFKGKHCIELGAGTSLTGIVAALMGASVTITDKPSLLNLIKYNIQKNISDPCVLERIEVCELIWGNGNPFSSTEFDVIFGADLTYDFEDLPGLISTLNSLAGMKSQVILAYGKEREATSTFLKMVCEKYFDIENHITESELDFRDITSPTFTINVIQLRKKTVNN